MDARKLRVCVVGAGVSGLAALKEVLEEGHSAVCFERETARLREGDRLNLTRTRPASAAAPHARSGTDCRR
jgi:glycine/D-amino acid oxidase-like deaminating enzyme